MKQKTIKKTRCLLCGLVLLTAVMLIGVLSLTSCASLTVVSIEPDTATGPERIGQGQDIRITDISVYANYKDESRKTTRPTSRRDVTFDGSIPGPQTVRFKVGKFEASFVTEVVPLSSITLVSPPSNLVYEQGESLNLTGLRVTGSWSGLPSADIAITASDISGFNTNTIGQQRLTITKFGRTASFNVTVNQAVPKTIVVTVGSDIAMDNNYIWVQGIVDVNLVKPGTVRNFPLSLADSYNVVVLGTAYGPQNTYVGPAPALNGRINIQARTLTTPMYTASIQGSQVNRAAWRGRGTYDVMVATRDAIYMKRNVNITAATTNITITQADKVHQY